MPTELKKKKMLKSILQTLFWMGVEAGLYLAEQGVTHLRVEDIHNSIIEGKRDDAVEETETRIRRLLK